MDKTWLYHNDFETKQQSIEWGEAALPLPKFTSENWSQALFSGSSLVGLTPVPWREKS